MRNYIFMIGLSLLSSIHAGDPLDLQYEGVFEDASDSGEVDVPRRLAPDKLKRALEFRRKNELLFEQNGVGVEEIIVPELEKLLEDSPIEHKKKREGNKHYKGPSIKDINDVMYWTTEPYLFA